MRPIVRFVVVATLVACGGDDDASSGDTVVDRDRPVPAELRAFLDRVADEHELAFTATYDVLTRFGGTETVVRVVADPPDVRIEAGEVVVVNGDDDAALSSIGIFSNFMTTGPARALEAAARRKDAGEPMFSEREAAGVPLDCVQVPVQQTTPMIACLTPDGLFGYVDNPAVRYELTAYTVN